MIWKIVKQIAKNGIRTEPAPVDRDAEQVEAGRIQDDVLAILGQALTIRMVMPARVTVANWRSVPWATRTTTSKAWVSSLSPVRAMPTCCW